MSFLSDENTETLCYYSMYVLTVLKCVDTPKLESQIMTTAACFLNLPNKREKHEYKDEIIGLVVQ